MRGRVLGPDGRTVPARIQRLASDGRGYVPERAFHRVDALTTLEFEPGLVNHDVTALLERLAPRDLATGVLRSPFWGASTRPP